MHKKINFFYYLIIFLVIQSSLQAWCSTGHKISAKIAYLNLTDEVREKIDEILPQFIESSVWADEIRVKEKFHLFDAWHYTNIPYDPESMLSPMDLKLIEAKNSGNDAVWFINQSVRVLSENTSLKMSSQILPLFVHMVADIHQPLHCCTRYSAKLKYGDKGGNLFYIDNTNLHQLWDHALGELSGKESEEEIEKKAYSFMNKFPKESFSDFLESNPKKWSEESQQIAVEFAYQTPEFVHPSEEYMNMGKEVACKRITLSGYRLANLLNKCFKE